MHRVASRRWAAVLGLLLAVGCSSSDSSEGRPGASELLTPASTASPAGGSPAASDVSVPRDRTPTAASPPPPSPATTEVDREFADTPELRERRKALVDTYIAPVVSDPTVLEAMRTVPRHAFVPTDVLDSAYQDHPLPIGHGQTISQPSLVAMMTELLELEPGDRVLEIGTGSGYQAAILRELTDEVYSVEIVPPLAATAKRVLDELGYGDVHVEERDGYHGWDEHAPFDAIVVTAAPDHLPQPLVAQLVEGGQMVIPIGPVGDVQTLWLVTREPDGVEMERVLDVRFVPFVRDDGSASAALGDRRTPGP